MPPIISKSGAPHQQSVQPGADNIYSQAAAANDKAPLSTEKNTKKEKDPTEKNSQAAASSSNQSTQVGEAFPPWHLKPRQPLPPPTAADRAHSAILKKHMKDNEEEEAYEEACTAYEEACTRGGGGRAGAASHPTAPGTPETTSLLGRHSSLETDGDESTSTVGLGEELERELAAMITDSPSPMPVNRRASESKTVEPDTSQCPRIPAWGRARYQPIEGPRRAIPANRRALKGRPVSSKVSEHAEVSKHAAEADADEKRGLTLFSELYHSLSESKPADPEKDVRAVTDAQEAALPPCGAAGQKRFISEEDPADAAVAMDSDEDGTCLSSIPKDDEFWVEFRKRQKFFRQLEITRAGRWP